MNRYLKLALIGLVASCGGNRNYTAPRNLDNACAIAAERPAYMRAMKATSKRWKVPIPVMMATIHQESKFVGNAKTPHQFALGIIPIGRQSSAYGYSQALDGTWKEYMKETGNRRARRDNIRDATDFMGWYMAGTRRELGIPLSDAAGQYLAYHEGRGGYKRGSHRSKPWLLTVAANVDSRASLYSTQLSGCGIRS